MHALIHYTGTRTDGNRKSVRIAGKWLTSTATLSELVDALKRNKFRVTLSRDTQTYLQSLADGTDMWGTGNNL